MFDYRKEGNVLCNLAQSCIGLQKRKGEWLGTGRGARDPKLPLHAEVPEPAQNTATHWGRPGKQQRPQEGEGGGPEHAAARGLLPECSGLPPGSWRPWPSGAARAKATGSGGEEGADYRAQALLLRV